jgi:hypothetical protein
LQSVSGRLQEKGDAVDATPDAPVPFAANATANATAVTGQDEDDAGESQDGMDDDGDDGPNSGGERPTMPRTRMLPPLLHPPQIQLR